MLEVPGSIPRGGIVERFNLCSFGMKNHLYSNKTLRLFSDFWYNRHKPMALDWDNWQGILLKRGYIWLHQKVGLRTSSILHNVHSSTFFGRYKWGWSSLLHRPRFYIVEVRILQSSIVTFTCNTSVLDFAPKKHSHKVMLFHPFYWLSNQMRYPTTRMSSLLHSLNEATWSV